MEWTDRAVILNSRRHGEQALIIEALTYAHGRHLGLVRGGRSARHRSTFQPGNTVELTWRARLEDHLGVYSGDMVVARAASVMDDQLQLAGLATATGLGRLLPEREPGPRLTSEFETLLDLIAADDHWLAGLVRLELAILSNLGFGLDLECCALTGRTDDLTWVSPKTGRAACSSAGEPYRDRLLALPQFLLSAENGPEGSVNSSVGGNVSSGGGEAVAVADILAGFRLTGHFLDRHVYGPRDTGSGEPRAGLLRALARKK